MNRKRDGTREASTTFQPHEADHANTATDEISKDLEIRPSTPHETYSNMEDLSDALPDNSPRFVLLSHPLTLGSGRLSVPYVMLNYLPATCSQSARMLYAGAKELMRSQSEVGRVVEIEDAEEVVGIEGVLQGED